MGSTEASSLPGKTSGPRVCTSARAGPPASSVSEAATRRSVRMADPLGLEEEFGAEHEIDVAEEVGIGLAGDVAAAGLAVERGAGGEVDLHADADARGQKVHAAGAGADDGD